MAKRNGNRLESDGVDSQGWLTTYGDMMTLLMTFFILILSFSSVKLDEFHMAMGSMKRALGLLKSPPSITIRPLPGIKSPKKMERLREIEAKILAFVGPRTKAVEVQLTPAGVRIRISTPFLFDLGLAELKPETYPVLDGIREMLLEVKAPVRVDGHTDNLQIHNKEFDSNWELSAARALAVVKYFLRHEMASPAQFYIAAYGEFKPVVPNDSEENRQRNRRVEIFIGIPENLEAGNGREAYE